MINHMKVEHGNAVTFECVICFKKMKYKNNWKSHMARIHGVGSVRTYTCDVCSKVFKEKRYLARHLESAHAELS